MMKKFLSVVLMLFIILITISQAYQDKISNSQEYEMVKFPLKSINGIRLLVEDMNVDGQEDLLISGKNKDHNVSEVQLIQILSEKNFSQSTIFLGNSLGGGELSAEDFNKDGYPDLITSEINKSANLTLLHLLIHNRDTDNVTFDLQRTFKFNNIDITDISSISYEGEMRLIIGGYILRNNSMDAFLLELDPSNGNKNRIWDYAESVILGLTNGDFNGDGYVDIAATINKINEESGEVFVFYSRGNGSFYPTKIYESNGYLYEISGGDINRDGTVDIVINDFSEKSFGKITIFEFYGIKNPAVRTYSFEKGTYIDSLEGSNKTLLIGATKIGRIPHSRLLLLSTVPENPKLIGEYELGNLAVKDMKVAERSIVLLTQEYDKKKDFLIIIKDVFK